MNTSSAGSPAIEALNPPTVAVLEEIKEDDDPAEEVAQAVPRRTVRGARFRIGAPRKRSEDINLSSLESTSLFESRVPTLQPHL